MMTTLLLLCLKYFYCYTLKLLSMQPGLTQRGKWFCRTRCLSLTKGPIVVPTLFFLFLGISGGQLAIVFCSWNFMIGPIWNNFSHRKRNLKSGCHPKNIFFLLMNLFWERPMRTRTNGKRGNSIYYTWKTFFKATRQKGRSNTDFFFIPKNIFFLLMNLFLRKTDEP